MRARDRRTHPPRQHALADGLLQRDGNRFERPAFQIVPAIERFT